MAQTTVLAAGTTAATSTDITVAAGAKVVVSMYFADDVYPADVELLVMLDTPGGDLPVDVLRVDPKTREGGAIELRNDTTTAMVYRVKRPATAYSVGAISVA